MPISASAKKSLRKSIKNKKVNVSFKTRLRSVIKAFLADPTIDGYQKTASVIDKAVKNEVFHKNKAARLKSSYSKKVGKGSATAAIVKKSKVSRKDVVKKSKASRTPKQM